MDVFDLPFITRSINLKKKNGFYVPFIFRREVYYGNMAR